jgi:hypothetical protein
MPLAHKVSPAAGRQQPVPTAARPAPAVSVKVTSVCQLSLSGGLLSSVSSTMISGTLGRLRIHRVHMQRAEVGGQLALLHGVMGWFSKNST